MTSQRSSRLMACLAGALLLFAAAPAFAQLPVARLTAIFPPGGQMGESFDVTLTGIDLDGVTELRFSQPGITAKEAGVEKSDPKFTIKIAADVPPGIYDVRAVGRYGITNPRAFAVGDRPEVVRTAAAAGDSPDGSAALPLDSVVNGRCAANAMEQHAIEAKKGQRIIIQCAARDIDSKLSPVLYVSDADGKELDRSRRGGMIDFTAPSDGRYTIKVHDLMYRGGPEYFYRLLASTGPYIDSLFPPCGEPGSKVKYTLYGRNLPGGSQSSLKAADGKALDELSVEIELPKSKDGAAAKGSRWAIASPVGPAGMTLDGIEYRLKGERGVSNPALITFARAPVVLEQSASNDKSAEAQKITLPCEVAGHFSPRADRDYYTFEAEKGDTWWFEMVADRLGQPTSAYMLVQKVKPAKDDKGEEQVSDVIESPETETNVGGPGFRTATRDASLKFEAKEAGTYRIMVRDLFNVAQDNPTLVYRLSIRKVQPDFRLVALPVSGSRDDLCVWSPLVRRGGSVPMRIVAFRQDGYDGEIRIEAEGLPKGVTCTGATLAPADTTAAVVITAADDVAAWSGNLRIVGKAKVGDEEVSREARGGAVVWGPPPAMGQGGGGGAANATEPIIARATRDELALAVCAEEQDPLSIAPAEDKVYEVQEKGKISIPLKVTRRLEVKAALKVKAAGLVGVNNAKEITIDPKVDTATLDLDLQQQKLPPGTYTFYLQTPAQVKYARGEPPAAKEEKKEEKKGGDSKQGDKGTDKGGEKPKKDEGNNKANAAKDTQAIFFSAPITLKVTPLPEKEKKKG